MVLEPIKGKSRIQSLFEHGSFFRSGKFKIVYTKDEKSDIISFGVSVPKRIFKNAVDRNLLKRRIRHSVFDFFKNNDSTGISFMIIYTSSEKHTFNLINEDIANSLKEIIG